MGNLFTSRSRWGKFDLNATAGGMICCLQHGEGNNAFSQSGKMPFPHTAELILEMEMPDLVLTAMEVFHEILLAVVEDISRIVAEHDLVSV